MELICAEPGFYAYSVHIHVVTSAKSGIVFFLFIVINER
jgi:hypothetical protein